MTAGSDAAGALTMSAKPPTTALLALPTVAPLAGFSKDDAWTQLQTTVDEFITTKQNLASFRATPLMKQLVLQIQKDYPNHADKFGDRPNIITHCRGGGTLWLPGNTQTPSDFMILEPIYKKGEVKIGGMNVDMNNYYVILERCDVTVEDDGVLVTLAMTDIR